MKRISMKQLRYFLAVAEHRHFGRAAEICAISQPALSIQIKELEANVGAKLVERDTRHVFLTPLGKVFAKRAGRIMAELQDMGEIAKAAQKQMTGRLKLGMIPTIAPYLLPNLIVALRADYPWLDIRPKEAKTAQLVADLRAGALDLVIAALPVAEPTLEEYPLFEEAFMLVRSTQAQEQSVPDITALSPESLLLLEEGHCFRDQALELCSLSTQVGMTLMQGSSLSTLVQMVGAGIGVTLIPEMAVPVETRAAEVEVLRFADPQPTRKIGALWRKTSPMAAHFKDILKLAMPPVR